MKFNLAISILILFSACKGDRSDDCLTSLGNEVSIVRSVEDYHKLYVEDRIQAVVVQDSSRYGEIEISGPENLLEQVTSFVEDNRLNLKNNNTCNFVRSFDYELKVKIFVKSISEIYIESIAAVVSEGPIVINKLEIYNYALSDCSLELSGNEVFVQSRNSAFTELRGKIKVLKGSIEEISELEASNLQCEEVLLDSHSPLNCTINASNGIFVNLYNSGNIIYNSEPSEYKLIGVRTGGGNLLKK